MNFLLERKLPGPVARSAQGSALEAAIDQCPHLTSVPIMFIQLPHHEGSNVPLTPHRSQSRLRAMVSRIASLASSLTVAGAVATMTFAAGALTAIAAPATPASATPAPAATPAAPFLTRLNAVTQIASTVPVNGDVNPYGVAVVTKSASGGKLVEGDTLVSNFNSKANVQGTGTTIMEVSPSGTAALFTQVNSLGSMYKCPGGVGLTTALGILPGGWVIVGSLPSLPNGDLTNVSPAGCLIVFNDQGVFQETLTNALIDGPWDMTVQPTPTGANLYIANALGGNTKTSSQGVPEAGECTITRIQLLFNAIAPMTAPTLGNSTTIGNDFPWRANQAAFVLAPTGLALATNHTLFITNTLTNSVSAIRNAATRITPVTQAASVIFKGGGLNAPLGMTMAPNGDLIVVNGNNGRATELTQQGHQVATRTLVQKGAGDLFGLAVTPNHRGLYFVDDGTNALDLAHHKG